MMSFLTQLFHTTFGQLMSWFACKWKIHTSARKEKIMQKKSGSTSPIIVMNFGENSDCSVSFVDDIKDLKKEEEENNGEEERVSET